MVSSASRNLNQLTVSFLRFLLRKTYCTINTDEHKEMKAVGFGTMAMAFCMEVKVDMVISKNRLILADLFFCQVSRCPPL